MSILPLNTADKVAIGNDAGYLLSFHREQQQGKATVVDDTPVLEFGRDDYYTEVRASLPAGLEGGVYSFVIEGLTDKHYAAIAQGKQSAPRVVRLYLFWRDTSATGLASLASMAGVPGMLGGVKGKDMPQSLVAELRIVSVTRKAGARRYETTVTARERVFDILSSQRLCGAAVVQESIATALDELLQGRGGLRRETHWKFYQPRPDPACGSAPVPTGGSDRRELPAGRLLADLLRDLGTQMEEQSGLRGRGMFLLRNGLLHIGARPIPLGDKQPKQLTLAKGLIEVEALEPVATDPNFDHCKNPGKRAPERRQLKLTLRGRPDLKPGDLVEIDLPPEDVDKTGGGILGAIGDLLSAAPLPSLGDTRFQNPVKLYVATVEHRLGRTSGFSTTLTGIELADPTRPWDCHSPVSGRRPETSSPAVSNPETEAAHAVRALTRTTLDNKSFPDVGEVRQVTTSGTSEPPAQTLTVWRGLAPGDGHPNQARRLPVERPSPAAARGVAYATPFAWGKCGLVLPRYPGTRVLLTQRNGSADDPIDVGALWESGHGPDSEAGDWWLILPVDVPPAQRVAIPDTVTPEEHNARATNDLIDADGNRVIEVGELTIRVGRDSLGNAGERPERGDEQDGITIEHADGNARIVIKQNGTIVIEAGKDIELKAPAGDIKIDAVNVKVKVSGSMDVS